MWLLGEFYEQMPKRNCVYGIMVCDVKEMRLDCFVIGRKFVYET